MPKQASRPDVSSPGLILTNPTETEQIRTWTASHANFGTALSLQDYLDRERYLLTIPHARDGGITQWILTDGSVAQDARPVLASCETLRKRALLAKPDGTLREGWAHGVASVFTYPEFRGNGYAGKMMAMLGDAVKGQDANSLFSILYSDIGKAFYATKGWKPFPSDHLEFPAKEPQGSAGSSISPIFYDDMAVLSSRDEQLIRKQLLASPISTRAAVLPDHDQMLWHLHREDFMCRQIFSRTPDIRGAQYTPASEPNSRVWAIWTRGYSGGKTNPAKNTLHILRFVVEDEAIPEEELQEAIAGIIGLAQQEAKQWLCARVEVWNPPERVRQLAQGLPYLEANFVSRESDSICSLKMLIETPVDDVDWIANEKFVWC